MSPNQVVTIRHKSGKLHKGYVCSYCSITGIFSLRSEPCEWYMFKDGYRIESDGSKVFLGSHIKDGIIRKSGGGMHIAAFYSTTGNQVGIRYSRSYTVVK